MPGVARCPICGEGPNPSQCGWYCCGVEVYGNDILEDALERWNRYAAAMELAEAALCYHNDSQCLSTFEKAAEMYREVFK